MLVSVVVVVVVEDEVVDEVEWGGREWVGREGICDRLRPEIGAEGGDLHLVERNSGGGIYTAMSKDDHVRKGSNAYFRCGMDRCHQIGIL